MIGMPFAQQKDNGNKSRIWRNQSADVFVDMIMFKKFYITKFVMMDCTKYNSNKILHVTFFVFNRCNDSIWMLGSSKW